MKQITVIIVIILSSLSAQSQSARQTRALELYRNLQYADAVMAYNSILNAEVDSLLIAPVMADCSLKLRDMVEAEKWLRLLVYDNPEALDFFKYAQALRANRKYDEAKHWVSKYYQLTKKERDAEVGSMKIHYYNQLSEDPGRFEIDAIDGNSEYAEFSPSYLDEDKIIFVSARDQNNLVNRKFKWDNTGFLDLYVADIDKRGNLTEPRKYDKELNTIYHEGPVSLSADLNRIYFTRNNYNGRIQHSNDKISKLKIYYADLKPNGSWSKPEEFEYNNDEYSTGHPALSHDGKRLYFASDMPGGYGLTDIYYCELDAEGNWASPVNMGPQVNSEANEMFPFMHNEGTLYLSSDKPDGYGGLDIYEVILRAGMVVKTGNLGSGINSNADDFGITMDKKKQQGFFSSTREGGAGGDDIYKFKMKYSSPLRIEGEIIDGEDGSSVNDAYVTLVNNEGDFIKEIPLDDDGNFITDVPLTECEYRVKIEGKIYSHEYFSKSTPCDVFEGTLNLGEIYVFKNEWSAKGIIKDAITKEPIEEFVVTLLDLANGIITDAVTKEDGEVVFPLIPNTNYEIRFEKRGYYAKSAVFSTWDIPPGERSIEKLTNLILDFELVETNKSIEIPNIYYDYNKASIRPDAAVALDKLIKMLEDNPTLIIELGAHTDSRGDDDYNRYLSHARAQSAVDYLIFNGIDKKRLMFQGYGEAKLINRCDNGVKCSEVEHQENRRTEFIVLDY